MELHNKNQSELLPYEKLALLGIDREKADSLPKEVKEKLVSGEVTPLMQVSISARNGNLITLPLKLQMTADKDGNPALIAYPVRVALETERNKVLRLTEQEAERLGKGEVLQKSRGGKRREDAAVPATRSGNEIGHPPQGNGCPVRAETERHGEGQRHRAGHTAEAAGTRGKAR